MNTLRELVAVDPWITHGLTVFTTNVVDLDCYRVWKADPITVPRFGRILRSTLCPKSVRKAARAQAAMTKRIALAIEREKRDRKRRKKETEVKEAADGQL